MVLRRMTIVDAAASITERFGSVIDPQQLCTPV
jgi:hypothetical protein